MSRRPARSRRSSSRKAASARKRLLRSESLEPRDLLSGNSFCRGRRRTASCRRRGLSERATPGRPSCSRSTSPAADSSASPTGCRSWQATPQRVETDLQMGGRVRAAGSVTTFSANGTSAAASTMVLFNEAGSYTFTVTVSDPSGASVSTVKTVAVAATLSGIRLVTPGGQVVNYPSILYVTGTSQTVVAQGLDQFGNVLATEPAFAWSAIPLSNSTPTPSLTTNNAYTETVAFTEVGLYGLIVTAASYPNISSAAELNVLPTLTSVRVTPNTASLCQGGKQQFAASGLDQFQNAMTAQPAFTWIASNGTISTAGLYTAPSSTGNFTITARAGSLAGTASVQVVSAAPTIVQPISVNGGAAITAKTAALSVLGSGPGARRPWSTTGRSRPRPPAAPRPSASTAQAPPTTRQPHSPRPARTPSP